MWILYLVCVICQVRVCVDIVPGVCNLSGESVCGYCTWCVNSVR